LFDLLYLGSFSFWGGKWNEMELWHFGRKYSKDSLALWHLGTFFLKVSHGIGFKEKSQNLGAKVPKCQQ
jgi:hypothetical protein